MKTIYLNIFFFLRYPCQNILICLRASAAAIEAAAVIADAIKQIKFRDSYLASKELALQDSLNNISTQNTSSDLLVTDFSIKETVRQLKKIEVMEALLSDIQKAKYLLNSGISQLM